MSAFFSTIIIGITKYFVKYLVKYLYDHIAEEIERQHSSKEQQKKDEASKAPYDQAIKTGTPNDIENKTEGRLNG